MRVPSEVIYGYQRSVQDNKQVRSNTQNPTHRSLVATASSKQLTIVNIIWLVLGLCTSYWCNIYLTMSAHLDLNRVP